MCFWLGCKRPLQFERPFAFQAGSWYWHFVDVVWLGLFVFVYVLSENTNSIITDVLN
ncbi:cytochrome c oxidase subunit 3 [Vibrio lentus]|nr:cytochrome c oxidase subunit 3 [Vibrio lentus]